VEELKLQWLTFNIKTFGGWGGWVSEKFQSLARICLWVYGPLSVIDGVPAFVEPDKDPSKWLKKDYKSYLKVRGLDEEGRIHELRAKVLAILELPEAERPPVLPPDYGEAEGMLSVIRSMVVMLTTILQPCVNGKEHSDILALRVRMFLNSVERFDKPLRTRTVVTYEEEKGADGGGTNKRKKKKLSSKLVEGKPMWLDKFNFLCLLNLPEILHEFGPARNYFEGKYLGERYVQEVKTARLKCPPKNVCHVLLEKLHQGKAMDTLADSRVHCVRSYRSTDLRITRRQELSGNVRVYADEALAIREFYSNKPLSLVKLKDEENCAILFYVNGCNRGDVACSIVRRAEEALGGVMDRLKYWKWELSKDRVDLDQIAIEDFAVLLPRIDARGEHSGGSEYTIVTKEWSPLMLENFAYSRAGIMEESKRGRLYEVDSNGIAAI
jgi:hypothetical protein